MKKVLFSLFSLSVFFFSCEKAEDEDPNIEVAKTPTEQLTAHGWIASSSITIIEYPQLPEPKEEDLLALFPECQKDNITYFRSDNTVMVDEGLTKCNPIDPQQVVGGTWMLFENDTKLRAISADSTVIIADITVENHTLTLEYVTFANSIRSTTKTTYRKK